MLIVIILNHIDLDVNYKFTFHCTVFSIVLDCDRVPMIQLRTPAHENSLIQVNSINASANI